MKNKVLVVAPHADDESLGCSGTLLRHIKNGDEVHWLIVTGMSIEAGFSKDIIEKRKKEISEVSKMYKFASVVELNFPPAMLDEVAKGKLIQDISKVVVNVAPSTIYTVYRNDAHSDHEVTYDAVMSATKTFRYPFIKKVLAYEVLSETDFGLKPEDPGFKPNVFVDISKYIDKKIEILNVFESEMGEFPFPRSNKAIRALATIRGVQSGCNAAEGFMLIKQVINNDD